VKKDREALRAGEPGDFLQFRFVGAVFLAKVGALPGGTGR